VPFATLPGNGTISGVGRSADGRLVAYWVNNGRAHDLWIAGADGAHPRRVAFDGDTSGIYPPGGAIFSPDGRSIVVSAFTATSQVGGGPLARVAVPRVDTATAAFVGPYDVGGYDPSADGSQIAFLYGALSGHEGAIGVMNIDGTGDHPVTDGRVITAHGADSWSSDAWIYFGAETRLAQPVTGFPVSNGVYRERAVGGSLERLTGLDVVADAAALSPSEHEVAYMVWTSQLDPPDLWVMNPDGSGQHLLAPDASILGWSADSRSVLAEISHTSCDSDLDAIPVDGSTTLTVLHSDQCSGTQHFGDVSWGFPRP
jgi:hypothetical protein